MARILVIEDNANLALGLRSNLEVEGHEVEVAVDGAEGLVRARAGRPDLILLDLMLPGLDGFRVIRSLRESGSRAPILVLTARGGESDKVRGLRVGADDYMTKPFSLLELIARVEALLRRTASAGDGARASAASRDAAPASQDDAGHAERRTAVERFGAVRVDPGRRTVSRNGRAVPLTPKEFDLLVALLRRRGEVVSRREILREIWGYPASVTTRTVDTHIAELRRKLEADPSKPRHILTVWKTGYRLAR